MEIARSAARKLALYRQGLDGHRTPSSNTAGVLEVIERLGYVQIDTISVVRRAHHHTFWVRVPKYQMGMLQDLQSQDRQVFEWWASAMSLVPMRDYRYYATRMDPKMVRSWHRNWYAENKDIVADVLDRIHLLAGTGGVPAHPPLGDTTGRVRMPVGTHQQRSHRPLPDPVHSRSGIAAPVAQSISTHRHSSARTSATASSSTAHASQARAPLWPSSSPSNWSSNSSAPPRPRKSRYSGSGA